MTALWFKRSKKYIIKDLKICTNKRSKKYLINDIKKCLNKESKKFLNQGSKNMP